MCYSALVKQDLKHLRMTFGPIEVRYQNDFYRGDVRLFPKSKIGGPVLTMNDSKFIVDSMRFSTFMRSENQKFKNYKTYNARIDNLKSWFWQNAFMVKHGLISITKFYEWVMVEDLIKAKVVKLSQVEKNFAMELEAKKEKADNLGKVFKPSKVDLTPAIDRKISIEFAPKEDMEMLAPTIISQNEAGEFGFAIVTNDPPFEVARAGHDRCPIFLTREAAKKWLSPHGKTKDEMIEVLSDIIAPVFQHQIAA